MTVEQVNKLFTLRWLPYYYDSVVKQWNQYSGTDDKTAIASPLGETEEGAVFDLSGRRVEKPGKGIYIRNGKKIVTK